MVADVPSGSLAVTVTETWSPARAVSAEAETSRPAGSGRSRITEAELNAARPKARSGWPSLLKSPTARY
jgi:hypothetical protein